MPLCVVSPTLLASVTNSLNLFVNSSNCCWVNLGVVVVTAGLEELLLLLSLLVVAVVVVVLVVLALVLFVLLSGLDWTGVSLLFKSDIFNAVLFGSTLFLCFCVRYYWV